MAAKKAKQKINAVTFFVIDEDDPGRYKVVTKNVLRYELAMDYVSIGMSFRQTSAAIQFARDHAKTAKLTGMNDLVVGQYVLVLVASSLQNISDRMDDESVWAMSLAFDSSTHREQAFFNLRVRMCFQGVLFNLRQVAIPILERHAAMNLFNMLVKFLDALQQPWREKLIGTSSDGKNTMTGRHGGLVTRIVHCAENNLLRVWCVPHQIDIVVKSSADGINDGAYVKEVYSFSVHLRSQNNLIIAMGVKCRKNTNRWVNVSRVVTFYKKYRRQIIQHTNENHPEKLPTDEWWVITNVESPAIDEVNVTFAKLQSQSLLIVQQQEIVNLLIGTLTGMFGIEVVDPENIGDARLRTCRSIRCGSTSRTSSFTSATKGLSLATVSTASILTNRKKPSRRS
jgi:hypothetical protein